MWWRETKPSIFDDDFASFGDVDSEDEVDELDSQVLDPADNNGEYTIWLWGNFQFRDGWP